MKSKIKESRAITLIALVITIIILLILTAITISTLTGENGLFARAKEAKIKTQIARIKEQIQIDIYDKQAENQGNISDDSLKEILQKYGTLSGEEKIIDKTLITTEGNYEIKVSEILNGTTAKDETKEPEPEPEPEIEIAIDKKNITLTIFNNNTAKVNVTINSTTSSEYTVDWSSSDTSVATVDENGIITAIGIGDAVISAKVRGMEKIDTCNVKVVDKICEFTEGNIYNRDTNGSSKTILQSALTDLTDGQYTSRHGNYGALMLRKADNRYLIFTLYVDVNIYFSSTSYGDTGGSSGETAYFYKEENGNYDTLYYTLKQENNSQKYGKMYFPAGKYKLNVSGSYVEFEQWDFETIN